MLNRIQKFFRLDSIERRVLMQIWLLLAQTRLWLWCFSFKKARKKTEQRTIPKQDFDVSKQRLAWMVQVASNYIPAATCLPQALAMDILMRSYGYPSNLRIGVAKDELGRIEAHAWVESEGEVIIGARDLSRFTPFSDLK